MSDERSWQDVPISVFLGGLAVFCVAATFCHSGQRWLPVVDGVNLLFHEAGHFFLGLVSDPLEVYGGTLGQLVFPVVTMGYFFQRGHTASFYVCGIWGVENLWNISRYLADARAQQLPLFGAGDRLHDWTEILTRWNCLERDLAYAGRLRALGWVIAIFLTFWFYWRWIAPDDAEVTSKE